MLMPSCRVLSQRVDFSWFGDTLSAPQGDTVYVESGQGLPAAEPSAASESAKQQVEVASASVAAVPVVPVSPPPVQEVSPAPVKSATSRAAARTHTVAAGDTLAAIARRYHSSIPAICTANGITNPNALKPGTVLTIPNAQGRDIAARSTASMQGGSKQATATPQRQQDHRPAPAAKRRFWQFWKKVPPAPQPSFYTVQAGDTLNAIAHRHGMTPTALMNANGMNREQANKLRIGQRLTLPAHGK